MLVPRGRALRAMDAGHGAVALPPPPPPRPGTARMRLADYGTDLPEDVDKQLTEMTLRAIGGQNVPALARAAQDSAITNQ